MEKIYKVTTEGDCEGRSRRTLGYVSGSMNDIKDYFDDSKTYSLFIEEIKVLHITSDSASEKLKLIQRKKELESELESIKDKLK